MRQRSKNNLIVDGLNPLTNVEQLVPVIKTDPLERCASAVIEIIPAVMDSMRSSLRSHVGDQLTVPQFRCLAFISRNAGCTVSEAACFMGVTKATASVMVDRLMRAGALLIVNDVDDRRRSLLHISSPGRAKLQAIRGEARKDFALAMSTLSIEELSTVNEGLEILRKTFRQDKVPAISREKLLSTR
jgi:DNA-binding MarR family transcriptional regulator